MALLEIGRIVRPHGLAGDVVVELVTNRAERLAPGVVLSARTQAGDELALGVERSRPHQHRFLVTFVGATSREAAEALRDARLFAEAIEDPEALFVHELIGCEVLDTSGQDHGRVASVEANPASDLLVGERGWLVPLRFVVERRPGVLVVEVPDGLFE